MPAVDANKFLTISSPIRLIPRLLAAVVVLVAAMATSAQATVIYQAITLARDDSFFADGTVVTMTFGYDPSSASIEETGDQFVTYSGAFTPGTITASDGYSADLAVMPVSNPFQPDNTIRASFHKPAFFPEGYLIRLAVEGGETRFLNPGVPGNYALTDITLQLTLDIDNLLLPATLPIVDDIENPLSAVRYQTRLGTSSFGTIQIGSLGSLEPTAVPLPPSLPLMAIGLLAAGFFGWRGRGQKRRSEAA